MKEDPRFQHAHITAVAGILFGDQQQALFGAEVGENLTTHVQAYANFTYFDNLITDSAQLPRESLCDADPPDRLVVEPDRATTVASCSAGGEILDVARFAIRPDVERPRPNPASAG